MGERRKVFRIEERSAAISADRSAEKDAVAPHAELMAQIAALRAVIEAKPRLATNADASVAPGRLAANPDIARIAETMGGHGQSDASIARITEELETVVRDTERATQKILTAAETIDQLANNLAATLRNKLEQDLAQDMGDLVIQIYEACNFQDLSGQRIGKVTAILKDIGEQVARLLQNLSHAGPVRRDGGQLLHGPCLEVDSAQGVQSEIDALFRA